MKKTIISHDTKSAQARIKFEHNGVVHEADYDLKLVVPGSQYTFEQMGVEFTKQFQLKAIDKLEETIKLQIEQGVITNPPAAPEDEYVAPPEVPVEKPSTKQK